MERLNGMSAVGVAVAVAALGGAAWVIGGSQAAGSAEPGRPAAPHVSARSAVEAGRYLVRVGGCNDCHTAGFMQDGEKVPEAKWLLGVGVGWRGPWGTSYCSNLRLLAASMTAEGWVQMCRSRQGRPPMPWASLNAMSEQDLAAIYAYLRHLGPAGEPAPAYVPPGEEPATPAIHLVPRPPRK